MASVTIETAQTDAATSGDDAHYEVVRGRRVEVPRMGAYETHIASMLVRWLWPFVATNGLGRVEPEMLFRIDPEANLQRRPDVAFVSFGRWPRERRVPRTAAWDVVPDLAIEVVSPTNTASEVVEKLGDYFRAGVGLVWVVYPTTAEVHVWDSPAGNRVRRRAESLDGGDVLPGFTLPLADLFDPEDEPEAADRGA